MKNEKAAIGQGIKTLRKERKISARVLAEAVNISTPYVYDIESGRTLPSVPVLNKIAQYFGVSTDYLMGRSDKKTPPPEKTSEGEIKSNVKFAPTPQRMLRVPVYSREVTACCGDGIAAIDITSEPTEFEMISHDDLREYDESRPPFAIYADGDCLESVPIRSGDKIIINPAEAPSYGTIGLVSMYGKLNLKFIYRLPNGDVILKSDDGERRLSTQEQEDADFRIIGAMVSNHTKRPDPRPL